MLCTPMQAADVVPGNLIDQITRDAVRRASMAPTYAEALDITGAALIAVADLVKAWSIMDDIQKETRPLLMDGLNARPEQTQIPPIHQGDRVRSIWLGRTGIVVKVYAEGSAAVCWDDGEPQPEGLAHERMPRRLLEVDRPAPRSASGANRRSEGTFTL